MSLFDRQRVTEIRMWADDMRQITHDNRSDEDALQSELFYQDIIELCNGILHPEGEEFETNTQLIKDLKDQGKELDEALNKLEEIHWLSR